MDKLAYKLFSEIDESRGMAYLNQCKGRSFSLNIFVGNLQELKKCCKLIETPEVGLRLMSSEHSVQAHRESMRLFHNFLASAKSLVDHTRVFVEDAYAGTQVQASYKQRVANTFSTDPLSKFVQDLRNYMVHKGLPGCQMSIDANNIGRDGKGVVETTVSLKKADLMTWDRWHPLSRDYLENAPGQIKLSALAASYGDKVLSFYNWFDSALNEFHAQDLNELKDLQERYALIKASGSAK